MGPRGIKNLFRSISSDVENANIQFYDGMSSKDIQHILVRCVVKALESMSGGCI